MIDLSDGVPGVSAPEPRTFEEFWPYYLCNHLHPYTRALHTVGTLAAWVVGIGGLVRRRPTSLLWAPFLAYAPAFASHFIWEKNRPVTLAGRTSLSVRADHRMLVRVLTGELGADLAAVRRALDMRPAEITLRDLRSRKSR